MVFNPDKLIFSWPSGFVVGAMVAQWPQNGVVLTCFKVGCRSLYNGQLSRCTSYLYNLYSCRRCGRRIQSKECEVEAPDLE